jgi:hypothetical protein
MTQWRNFEIDGTFRPLDVEASDWNVEAYERDVVRDLERIAGTETGRLMLAFIGPPVLVVPYTYRFREINASLDPAGNESGSAADVGRPGPGLPSLLVRFTPAVFDPPDPPPRSTRAGVHQLDSHAVLFHELCHVVDGAWGTLQAGFVSYLSMTEVRESEHRATRFANFYHSEVHLPLRGPYYDTDVVFSTGEAYRIGGLRALERRYDYGHAMTGYRALRREPRIVGDPRHEAYIVLENYLMDRWVRDLPALTIMLERLPPSVCEYNPLRDFATQTYQHVYLPEAWFYGGPAIDRSPVQYI